MERTDNRVGGIGGHAVAWTDGNGEEGRDEVGDESIEVGVGYGFGRGG